MWWHQHKPGRGGSPEFLRRDLFAPPNFKDDGRKNLDTPSTLSELHLFEALNKYRGETRLPPFRAEAKLWRLAQDMVQDPKNESANVLRIEGGAASPEAFLKKLLDDPAAVRLLRRDGAAIGIGHQARPQGMNRYVILLSPGPFQLFSQSHALHLVDVNGDGLNDLVTGRRWWAHGPKGDAGSGGPAVLYWFEAKKGADGLITFVPHLIDDDSGIGTQFTVADINGDGLPDVVIGNKRGVFVFEQVMAARKE